MSLDTDLGVVAALLVVPLESVVDLTWALKKAEAFCEVAECLVKLAALLRFVQKLLIQCSLCRRYNHKTDWRVHFFDYCSWRGFVGGEQVLGPHSSFPAAGLDGPGSLCTSAGLGSARSEVAGLASKAVWNDSSCSSGCHMNCYCSANYFWVVVVTNWTAVGPRSVAYIVAVAA